MEKQRTAHNVSSTEAEKPLLPGPVECSPNPGRCSSFWASWYNPDSSQTPAREIGRDGQAWGRVFNTLGIYS